ncbi:BCCT transporter [Bacillus cereus]|uniref:BCCT family transporter n=1 Tax=Bacillus cereus TaxID=1396 RepID=UPI000BEE5624|nr:BCCT family transporter [Bacillus cereus]PED03765.1 BCCT transporter [Bacillus cereus]PEQ28204.1 BCCT transporter [Bacillus cereus]PEV66051.1 BCCT transporter [Bacillus cereus]PEX62162.1 BCCT transporter [Bacillus cereus]PFC30642.1 BCCT transporter [Bacillus cereus]
MRMKSRKTDWPVFIISGGSLLLFVIAVFLNKDYVESAINKSFAFSIKYFGAFWQILLLGTFIVAMCMAFSKYGRVKLGGLEKPEISTAKWLAIIMSTLLAGGGVFWAAAEPMYHLMTVPPIHDGISAGTKEAVMPALAQSYMHWGFLAWTILGTISAVVMMYGHYHKDMPLKPRTLLYPIFGKKLRKSLLGTIIDAAAIIAVAAGTIGPIGFLGLQASYGLQELFGISDVFTTQLAIIVCVVAVSTISAVTGIDKGIQIISNLNVRLAIVLMAFILLFGPGGFIIDSFVSSFGFYVNEFIPMSTYRGDASWLGSWTIFFWGWFIGYGPMMAILVSRISRGRTIREIIVAIGIIAPIITTFWFTILGGSGVFYELMNPGSISDALSESGMPAAMIAITGQLPLSNIIGPAFLLLTILFVVTTGDSMAYSISMAVTGDGDPRISLRIFWSLIMGAVAAILLYMGEGSINALQSFIVVTAVPVSILLFPMLWLAPKVAGELALKQGIVKEEDKTAFLFQKASKSK